jgi:hypothetical protein
MVKNGSRCGFSLPGNLIWSTARGRDVDLGEAGIRIGFVYSTPFGSRLIGGTRFCFPAELSMRSALI